MGTTIFSHAGTEPVAAGRRARSLTVYGWVTWYLPLLSVPKGPLLTRTSETR